MRADDPARVLRARSDIAFRFMAATMRRQARRQFHAVRLAAPDLPAIDGERPVIVYSNHPSWWDAVLFVLLQAHCFAGRAGYGPMEAQSLARYAILRRIGIFAVEPGTRQGAAQFLRVAAAVLRTPRTVLWVNAEGRFTDARQRPVRLRPGIAHLMRDHPDAVAIPLALEYPFWNESRPEALARFGPPVAGAAGRTVAAWDADLTGRLTATMDRLAADAIARDPARFTSIVVGSAGIGGVYDLWRRARAALRGQRAQLAHEPAEAPAAIPPLTRPLAPPWR